MSVKWNGREKDAKTSWTDRPAGVSEYHWTVAKAIDQFYDTLLLYRNAMYEVDIKHVREMSAALIHDLKILNSIALHESRLTK